MAHKKQPPFAQADDFFVIAKSDTVNFADDATNNPQAYPLACIYVGGAGDVSVVAAGKKIDGTTDNAVTFAGLAAGTFLPVLAKRVNSTGTTATSLVGMVGFSAVG